MTKNEYTEATPKSPMFALDCEMCTTNKGTKEEPILAQELTRISLVNEKLEVIFKLQYSIISRNYIFK